MRRPGSLRLFRIELDDRDPFAVVGHVSLVRDIARHAPGKLAHADGPARVLFLRLGPETRAEHGNQHRGAPKERLNYEILRLNCRHWTRCERGAANRRNQPRVTSPETQTQRPACLTHTSV